MKLTKHAEKRIRQRGFSYFSLEIIENFGRYESAPGNATKVFLGKKECQQMISELKRHIQLIERAKGSTIIISGDTLLTVYK